MSRPGPPNTYQTGPVRLRQIALVAKDLGKAKDLLTYVLGTEVIYVDPQVGQWGLENILVAVGGEVIEVVSPTNPGTAAGRTLDKQGDGGYMIIMQHPDAQQRREFIEKRDLAKVIWSHERDDGVAVQYHPKGIQGGVIPELDSHKPAKANPTPLQTKFSPWQPCGPDEESYIAGMKRAGHLALTGVVCRLAPGDAGSELAATQWEQTFGVPRSRDLVAFTNARLGFLHGEEGKREGIDSITIGVRGLKKRNEIWARAKERGLLEGTAPNHRVVMFGITWRFNLTGYENEAESKL